MSSKFSIESQIFLRSHDEEKAEELLETRYNTADQKFKLNLNPTEGNIDFNEKIRKENRAAGIKSLNSKPRISAASKIKPMSIGEEGKISKKKFKSRRNLRKDRRDNARDGLKSFIQKAQKNQKILYKRIYQLQRKKYKENNALKTDSDTSMDIDDLNDISLDKWSETKFVPQLLDFLPIYNLWRSYMIDLLFGKTFFIPSNSTAQAHGDKGVSKGNKESHNIVNILPKLASADYNGSFLTVVSSKNPSNVGLSGIVLWDAKNIFVIVVPQEDGWRKDFFSNQDEDNKILTQHLTSDNNISQSSREIVGGLRLIEKKGCQFSFKVPIPENINIIGSETTVGTSAQIIENEDNSKEIEFVIIGSRFQFRSVDRSGRKFKSRNVEDITL